MIRGWSDLEYFLFAIAVFILAFVISTFARRGINKFIKRKSDLLKADPTNFSFLKNSISAVLYITALILVFYTIPTLHSASTALFAGAGILAAIIGFASQKAFSNIISGIFILMFKPFRVGDVIDLEDASRGIVEEITLRHTIIRDYEHRRIIIPNSLISDQSLRNSDITDERIRKRINFSISYSSSIDLAKRIVKEEISKHPYCLDVRDAEDLANGEEKVPVRVVELAEFSVVLRAWVWCDNTDNAFDLTCDVLESIKKRFDKEGIEIPFPYRNVIMK